MNKSLRFTIFSLIAMMFSMQMCLGQINSKHCEKESISQLTDKFIRKEVSSIMLSGPQYRFDSLNNINLQIIPLKRCSDFFAYFEIGNIISSELIVSLEAENKDAISEIRVLFGRYDQLLLPDSALIGISNAKMCLKFTRKHKPVESKSKVFRSLDKRRIYIYMLNGDEANRYEVTWIIKDKKYLTRVIEPVN